MHERPRTALRRIPDGLIGLFGDDLTRECARDREIHVILVQHACGEGEYNEQETETTAGLA